MNLRLYLIAGVTNQEMRARYEDRAPARDMPAHLRAEKFISAGVAENKKHMASPTIGGRAPHA